jgi:hypothetical protein
MARLRALFGLVLFASLTQPACGSNDASAPALSEWCTEPPRDSSGNTVLTLVKRPDAELPPKISVAFNDQPEVTFVDDGTGLDVRAGDGIYTHSAKVPVTPTEHSCNPVLTSGSGTANTTQMSRVVGLGGSGDYGAIAQAVTVMGSCSVRTCGGCLGASLGLPCFCVSCSVTITF